MIRIRLVVPVVLLCLFVAVNPLWAGGPLLVGGPSIGSQPAFGLDGRPFLPGIRQRCQFNIV